MRTMFTNLWFAGPVAQCELPLACIEDCTARGDVTESVTFWVDRLAFDGPAWLIRRRLLWIWACDCRESGAPLPLVLDCAH